MVVVVTTTETVEGVATGAAVEVGPVGGEATVTTGGEIPSPLESGEPGRLVPEITDAPRTAVRLGPSS